MKRITSIDNAIAYFRNGSKRETKTLKNGKEYERVIPPTGYHHMNVTYKGWPACTQLYKSFMWRDYAAILERDRNKISKLVLYYE